MTVADRIKALREERQLSQDELARRMGYSNRSMISKIEASGNKITLKIVSRAAAALGVSEAYLMGWNDPEEDDTALSDRAVEMAHKYDKADNVTKEMVDRILKEE